MKIQNAVAKKTADNQLAKYRRPVDATRNPKIKKIENTPMADDWQPSEDDLDLSDLLKKPDGTHSVRYACSKLVGGYIPHGLGKGSASSFYMQSTNHSKYFKISITWEADD